MKRQRETSNIKHGMQVNWASDALDCYLEGMSKADIAKIMKVKPSTVGNAICKEALFRLMQAKAVERLEDLDLEKVK